MKLKQLANNHKDAVSKLNTEHQAETEKLESEKTKNN